MRDAALFGVIVLGRSAAGYVAVQAQTGGPVTVEVGQAVPVLHARENQPLGHGLRLEDPFSRGPTRVLKD